VKVWSFLARSGSPIVKPVRGDPARYPTFNGGRDTYCGERTLVDTLLWALSGIRGVGGLGIPEVDGLPNSPSTNYI